MARQTSNGGTFKYPQESKVSKSFVRPDNDLYLQHRARMRKIKASVDSGSPAGLNVYKFLRVNKVENDAHIVRKTFHDNKSLLMDIYAANKKINTKLDDEALRPFVVPLKTSNAINYQKFAKRVEMNNRILISRIQEIANASKLETEIDNEDSTFNLTKRNLLSSVPAEVLRKYNRLVKLPKNLCMQNKIFRPRVYFDLQAKDERSLGRIVVQLFTEASPSMVLEFLRFCAAGDCKKIHFPRLYQNLWIEGEMTLPHQYHNPIDYDMQALKKSSEQGVLYFALQDFKVFRQGVLPFSISFRPITINDGKHFAFGKIIKGFNNFQYLSDLGTKCVKPLKEIFVTSMGLIGT